MHNFSFFLFPSFFLSFFHSRHILVLALKQTHLPTGTPLKLNLFILTIKINSLLPWRWKMHLKLCNTNKQVPVLTVIIKLEWNQVHSEGSLNKNLYKKKQKVHCKENGRGKKYIFENDEKWKMRKKIWRFVDRRSRLKRLLTLLFCAWSPNQKNLNANY